MGQSTTKQFLLTITDKMAKGQEVKKLTEKLFKKYDKEKRGKLTRKRSLKLFTYVYYFLHLRSSCTVGTGKEKHAVELALKHNLTDKAEAKAMALEWFLYYDTNGDGMLSYDEMIHFFNDFLSGNVLGQDVRSIVKNNLVLSGGIIQSAKVYLAMLKEYYDLFVKSSDNLLKKYVKAYRRWLVLRRVEKVPIEADKEIEFMLMVHMLHPQDYVRICQEYFSEIYDREKMIGTKPAKKVDVDDLPEIKVDMVKSARGQLKFYGKLLELAGGSHDKLIQDAFLSRAAIDYRKFLHIRKKKIEKKEENSLIVPTLYIDLMWHAHMCNPAFYHQDCIYFTGGLMDHKDTVDDTVLNDCFNQTSQDWQTEFGEAYVVSVTVDGYTTTTCTYGGSTDAQAFDVSGTFDPGACLGACTGATVACGGGCGDGGDGGGGGGGCGGGG